MYGGLRPHKKISPYGRRCLKLYISESARGKMTHFMGEDAQNCIEAVFQALKFLLNNEDFCSISMIEQTSLKMMKSARGKMTHFYTLSHMGRFFYGDVIFAQ